MCDQKNRASTSLLYIEWFYDDKSVYVFISSKRNQLDFNRLSWNFRLTNLYWTKKKNRGREYNMKVNIKFASRNTFDAIFPNKLKSCSFQFVAKKKTNCKPKKTWIMMVMTIDYILWTMYSVQCLRSQLLAFSSHPMHICIYILNILSIYISSYFLARMNEMFARLIHGFIYSQATHISYTTHTRTHTLPTLKGYETWWTINDAIVLWLCVTLNCSHIWKIVYTSTQMRVYRNSGRSGLLHTCTDTRHIVAKWNIIILYKIWSTSKYHLRNKTVTYWL